MPKANIHCRNTLEEVYPPDALAGDAAQNARAPSTGLSGVRVLSAPLGTHPGLSAVRRALPCICHFCIVRGGNSGLLPLTA